MTDGGNQFVLQTRDLSFIGYVTQGCDKSSVGQGLPSKLKRAAIFGDEIKMAALGITNRAHEFGRYDGRIPAPSAPLAAI